jgi:hypothetical protein
MILTRVTKLLILPLLLWGAVVHAASIDLEWDAPLLPDCRASPSLPVGLFD